MRGSERQHTVTAAREGWRLFLLAAFFASGTAGLIYEVVWARMFGTVFGNTTFAIGTVLAAFMGGLAVGSWLFGRWADRASSPLRLYAFLEFGIALYALIFPTFLHLVQGVYKFVFVHFGYGFVGFTALRAVFSLLLLIIPTTLMGGTLPALSRAVVRSDRKVGYDVGLLYAVNTTGAVIGAFLAGFFLIPWLGVSKTTYLAALLNGLAGTIGLFLARTSRTEAVSPHDHPHVPLDKITRAVVGAAFVWGFAAFCYEVFWSRVLVFTFSSSTYAFATMLVTFLIGLALGSYVGTALADKLGNAMIGLARIQLGVGIGALFSLWALANSARFYEWAMVHIRLITWWHWNLMRFLEAFFVMLPSVVLMGMAFPVAVRLVSPTHRRVGTTVGRLYAWNTLGGVAGSLAASFLLLPLVGTEYGLLIASSLNFLVAIGLFQLGYAGRRLPRVASAVPVAVVALSSFVIFPPGYLLRVFNFNQKGSELVYCKEGVNGTITVHQYPDYRVVCVNNVLVAGTAFDLRTTQKLQGHIPMLLHPNPKRVMQVGYGTGETSRVVTLYGVERLDGIELVPEIVDASRFFLDINGGVFENPVFYPIFADGKNYAALTPAKYDVIMNDSVHPAEVANASLYTLEYFRDCRQRLNDDGIMSSWLPLFGLSLDDFRCILRTFQEVFPHSTLWIANNYRIRHALLVGWKRDEPFRIDLNQIERRLRNPAIRKDLAEIHILSAVDVLDCLVLDEVGLREFTKGAPVNTDDQPYLDFHVPRVLGPDELIWARNLEAALRFRRAPWKVVRISGPDSAKKLERLKQQAIASTIVWRGIVSELRGEIAQARRYYRIAARLNPADPDPPFLLAASRETVQQWRRKAEQNPQDFEAQVRLGAVYLGEGKLDSAEISLERAIELNPRAAEAHANLGVVLLTRGEPQEAIEHLRRALELDPQLPLAYYNLGLALAQGRGDFRAAVEAWRRAIELDPDYQPAHFNLALGLLKLNQREEAIRELKTCIELQPDDATSHRLLGLLYLEAGAYPQAQLHLREYLRLAPLAADAEQIRQKLTEIATVLKARQR